MRIQSAIHPVESLALNWMYGRLDAYGECRDSERTLCVREPVGMANCVDSHAQTVCHTSSESLALNWMNGRLDAYGECLFLLIASASAH